MSTALEQAEAHAAAAKAALDTFQASLKRPPTEPQEKTVPVEPPSDREATPTDDDPLTEKEAIRLVQEWAELDEEVDSSERETFEEMVNNLKEAAKRRTSSLSASRLAEIISTYAPNAPRKSVTSVAVRSDTSHPYPPELAPLVESGVARFEYGYWLVNRCDGCGQFKNECCGRIRLVSAVRDDGQTFTSYGRQAVGLDPIKVPEPPKSLEQILQEKTANMHKEPWWNEFRGLTELEGDGTLKMYIENFLPEGVTLLCGLYKEGKSFLALSIAKALTSGRPLWERPGYEVPETVPVLYLAAESGDSELKMRCKKFGITEDKTRFITRTLSKGPMLGLNDPNLELLVKAMKPVIILETLIRFSDGDEDDASDNRQLAQQIFQLIGLGARAVIVIHHSIKAINKSAPTKSEAARGSGDILAMADVIWLAMQDDRLYQSGKGVNEISVVGWGRDFNPIPMRLALTGKAENFPPGTRQYAPGIVSYIDTQGNFHWVDKIAQESKKLEFGQLLEQLITENPSINLKELSQKTGRSKWEVGKTLKKLGYHRARGGKSDETSWTKAA